MIVESDFKFDYSKVDVLPDRFVDNLNVIAVRKKRIERVKELQKQIENLKMDLAAETCYIASEVLRNNTFPRFNGLNDFVSGVTDAYLLSKNGEKDNTSNYKTFLSLAFAIGNGSIKETPNVYKEFRMRLNDFIWLFFQGGGAVSTDELSIDYHKCTTMSSSFGDLWPAQSSYYFNALNLKNGKAYSVCFGFCDLKNAIEKQNNAESYNQLCEVVPYENVRRCNFGAVNCYVSEIMKKRDSREQTCGLSVYFASFDPIEIATFVKKTILEGIETKT